MRYLVSVLALLALMSTSAMAQESKVTLTAHGGQFSPSAEFDDGSTFTNGTLYGGSLTWWRGENHGFRGSVLWSRSEANAISLSPLEAQDPMIILYTADMLLKPSFSLLGFNPYIFGGVGGKHYALTKHNRAEGYTSLAFSVGGGVDLDLTRRLGLQGEARYTFDKFEHYHYADNQRDLYFAGGLVFKF